MQLGEQAEAVGADRRVVDIDHHVVKKSIDRGAQRGQRLQGFRVIAGDEGGIGTRHDVDQRGVQGDFGGFLEQGGINPGVDAAFNFFQDIANALVGRGQRGGFR